MKNRHLKEAERKRTAEQNGERNERTLFYPAVLRSDVKRFACALLLH
jgi:hypothetical protein